MLDIHVGNLNLQSRAILCFIVLDFDIKPIPLSKVAMTKIMAINFLPGQNNRVLSRLMLPLYPICKCIEYFLLAGYSENQAAESETIFLVGPPRSGTTICYQLLTHFFDVAYPDNLASLFPTSPIFGMWASKKVFAKRYHNSFSSIHGHSLNDFHGPNEWEQMFDNYYTSTCESTKLHQLQGILAQFNYITKHHSAIFKTLKASLHIKEIAKAIPNSKFIYIKRRKEDVIRSIYKAKRRENVPESEVWYVRPEPLIGKNFTNEISQIAHQIDEINSAIDYAFDNLTEQRHLSLDYDGVCNDPKEELARIKQWSGHLMYKQSDKFDIKPQLHGSSNRRLSREIEALISANVR